MALIIICLLIVNLFRRTDLQIVSMKLSDMITENYGLKFSYDYILWFYYYLRLLNSLMD